MGQCRYALVARTRAASQCDEQWARTRGAVRCSRCRWLFYGWAQSPGNKGVSAVASCSRYASLTALPGHAEPRDLATLFPWPNLALLDAGIYFYLLYFIFLRVRARRGAEGVSCTLAAAPTLTRSNTALWPPSLPLFRAFNFLFISLIYFSFFILSPRAAADLIVFPRGPFYHCPPRCTLHSKSLSLLKPA